MISNFLGIFFFILMNFFNEKATLDHRIFTQFGHSIEFNLIKFKLN